MSIGHSTKGQVLALFGPDGSGKTTAANELEKLCANEGYPTVRFHWRPRLLPSWSTISGNANKNDFEKPHSHKERGTLASVLIYIYIFMDFWIGYFFRLRPFVMQGWVVIYERYFYDMIFDSRRYGLRSIMWLSKTMALLLPKLDRVFILDGCADVLLSRKKELPREEILRQQRLMNAVLPTISNVIVIDVEKNEPSMVAAKIFKTLPKHRKS